MELNESGLATTVRIRALMPSLAPAEVRVAERVLADPTAVAASTISDLARDCATSETTVLRFCRAVGFTGYPALRLALAAEHGRSEGGDSSELTGDIAADDDLDKVVAKIAFADARAVEETAQQLDLDALHEVIDALVAAPPGRRLRRRRERVRRPGLPAEAAPHRPGRVRLARPAHGSHQRGAAHPG